MAGDAGASTPVLPEQPEPAQPPDQPKRRHRLRNTLIIVGVVLALLVGAGVATAVVLFRKLDQITIIDIPGAEAPAEHEPVNILLLGSDSRAGKGNKRYGLDAGRGGKRSDTTILLHISADRSRALAVSIPRDLWVAQPKCAAPAGTYYDKFNNAFDAGGAACTRDLVQQISGVNINHVVIVDFAGFKELIDAMDGVEVCLNSPIHDQDSELDLPAGTSVVSGEQALGFVRARKTVGDGSDIGRIKRQQVFLSAAIRKVTAPSFLLNPARTYELMDVATRSLTVSQGLDGLLPMKQLADSVRSIKPEDITFVTMPFVYRDDMANVDPDTAAALPIWDAMKNDTPWPPPVTVAADGKKLTVAPKDIWVTVVNRSGGRVADRMIARQLEAAHFNVNGITQNRARGITEVQSAPDFDDSARTLAYATGAQSVSGDSEGVTLVVGKDWRGVKSDMMIAKPKSQADPTQEPTRANQVVCAN